MRFAAMIGAHRCGKFQSHVEYPAEVCAPQLPCCGNDLFGTVIPKPTLLNIGFSR